jgi:type I site-specific restriction endonuclease
MEPSQFRKALIWGFLASPWIGPPLGLGACSFLLGAILQQPFIAFLGITGVLFGAAVATTRWMLKLDQLAQRTAEDLQSPMDRDHNAYLNQLAKRLRADKDPRNDQQLEQLRHLYARLERAGVLGDNSNAELLSEIREKAERLYRSCLASLERTVDLGDLAREMATAEFRDRVLRSREELLREIDRSIHHLGATVDHLQAGALHIGAESEELSKMRHELDFGLQVARRVEERMARFDESLKGLDAKERQ